MSFELPTGYDCIVPTSSDTQVRAYTVYRRDTYDLIGFDWVKTSHQTYTYAQDLSGYDCYSNERLVPFSAKISFVLPAVLIVLAFFGVILNMFMAIRRRSR